MTVPFELGEQKHVRLRVCSCKNENFLITAASYELYYRGAKEPEDTGHPEIQEHILDTLIQPKKKGIEKTTPGRTPELKLCPLIESLGESFGC